MSRLGISIPLTLDEGVGFTSIVTFKQLVRQNLKMLILTMPGERVMVPEYGVGLKQYLFSNFGENVFGAIQQKITEQVNIYLPAVKINDIIFDSSESDTSTLGLTIKYSIPRLGIRDNLQVTT